MKRLQKEVLLETLADIAYLAGVHKYYSGDSREDMQRFIHLAKNFEDQYSDVDWDKTDLDYTIEIENFVEKKLGYNSKHDIHITLCENPDKLFISSYLEKEDWDNVEIERVKDDGEDCRPLRDEEDKDIKEDYWSVYLHRNEGGVICVVDVPTEKQANQIVNLIKNSVLSFKQNAKFLDDIDRPTRDTIVSVILTLKIHQRRYTETQVGYVEAQKLIDQLNKLL